MKLRFAALLAPFLLAASPAAAANSALDEARALTSKATVEYDVGHFDQALELYTKAYERYPKAPLLFDIAQCHRLLGHFERAIFFFHGYLREQPDAPNRAQAEKLLDDSQKQLDAQKAADAAAAQKRAADAAAPPAEAASASPSSPSQAANDANPPPGETPPPTPGHGSPALRIAGLATAGVGVVLLGVGAFEGLHAQSLSNQVSQVSSQHGTWNQQDESNYNSGKSAASAATILFVVGGVAVGTGALLTWLGWPKSHTVSAGVAPLPRGLSAGLVARF